MAANRMETHSIPQETMHDGRGQALEHPENNRDESIPTHRGRLEWSSIDNGQLGIQHPLPVFNTHC